MHKKEFVWCKNCGRERNCPCTPDFSKSHYCDKFLRKRFDGSDVYET